jgi:hypothetical protein
MQDKVEGSNRMAVAGGNVVGEEDRIGVEDTEAVAYNMDLVVDGIGTGSAATGVHSGSAAKDACSAVGDIHSGSAARDACSASRDMCSGSVVVHLHSVGKCSGFGWQEYTAAETKIRIRTLAH